MKTPILILTMMLAASTGAFVVNAAVPAQNETQPAISAPTAPPEPTRPGAGRFAGLQKACASDFQTLCPGMTPGDGKLGPCIRENIAKLSPQCSGALQAMRGQRSQ
jgi:hypothetical protein